MAISPSRDKVNGARRHSRVFIYRLLNVWIGNLIRERGRDQEKPFNLSPCFHCVGSNKDMGSDEDTPPRTITVIRCLTNISQLQPVTRTSALVILWIDVDHTSAGMYIEHSVQLVIQCKGWWIASMHYWCTAYNCLNHRAVSSMMKLLIAICRILMRARDAYSSMLDPHLLT